MFKYLQFIRDMFSSNYLQFILIGVLLFVWNYFIFKKLILRTKKDSASDNKEYILHTKFITLFFIGFILNFFIDIFLSFVVNDIFLIKLETYLALHIFISEISYLILCFLVFRLNILEKQNILFCILTNPILWYFSLISWVG